MSQGGMGPPPVPYRARNKGTDAQLASAKVAMSSSWKASLVIIGIMLGFFVLLVLLDLLG